MNQGPPPQLPPGWIALWDETAQRYYYVEQATGTTQWELPNGATKAAEAGMGNSGEASSYGGGYPQQSSPYPQQAGVSPNAAVATAYPTQEGNPTGELNPDGTDRGIGKVFSGFSGGAITGGLIGYAAGKYFNKPKYQNQYQPPPPPSGGFGSLGSFAGFGGFGGGNNNYGGGNHGGRNEHQGGHNNYDNGGYGPGGFGGPNGPGGYGGPGGFGGPSSYNPPVAGKKHGW